MKKQNSSSRHALRRHALRRNTLRRNVLRGHALLMVGRNIRSYLLLSVTIILSFAFLLGFFVLTDSKLYNTYKLTFGANNGSALLSDPFSGGADAADKTAGLFNLMLFRLSQMENTCYYQYGETQTELWQYRTDTRKITATLDYVPCDFQEFYGDAGGAPEKLDIVSGKGRFDADDEVIVDETLNVLLGGADTVILPYQDENGSMALKTYRVVGVMEAETRENQKGVTAVRILLPLTDTVRFDKRYLLVSSEKNIREIAGVADALGIGGVFSYKLQNEALTAMRTQVTVKGASAMILFLLLGINLYSSFKNALNDRKFEIGVKRAIGAKKRDIVAQFFREGMAVMLANLAASVLLVCDVAAVYKLFQKVFHHTEWVIDLSLYSAVIFVFSAFFLSVSFSLLFAWQSTNVEIASHLKAE